MAWSRPQVAAAAIVASLVAAPALAEEEARQIGRFTFAASVGVMWGKANEYAYNADGSKLSQLIWRYRGDAVVNGGVTWSPLDWLTIGVKGRTNLTDDSKIDDYDWGIAACPGSICHSIHDDTNLTRTGLIDLYGAVTLPIGDNLKISGIAGYKWDYSKWQAHNGVANYGSLPSGLAFIYEQWWEAPYLGVEVKAAFDRFSLTGRVTGSPWSQSHDLDHHVWTATNFDDSFGSSTMIEATASLGYALSETWNLKLEYEYQRWSLAKGPTTTTYLSTGTTVVTGGDAAGADNITQSISLGASKSF